MTITLEVASILLSVVAFLFTVIGFFASLKFYRDSIELQRAANDALTQISERTGNMQNQMGKRMDYLLSNVLERSK